MNNLWPSAHLGSFIFLFYNEWFFYSLPILSLCFFRLKVGISDTLLTKLFLEILLFSFRIGPNSQLVGLENILTYLIKNN